MQMGRACSTHGKTAFKILVGKPEFKDHLRHQGPHGRMLLNWVLKKENMGVWSKIITLRIRFRDELL
jgi:hypothetical protein